MTVQNNKKWTVAAILGVVATIAVYAVATTQAGPANGARREMMTAQQAALQSAPICRLLSSKPGELQQFTEEYLRVGIDGMKHKIWVVDCVDSEGQHVVHTVWDAETGKLFLAAHGPKRELDHNATAVSGRGVAQTAWYWLESLGVSRTAPRWKVSQPPQLNHESWIVVLSCRQYDATVIFDKNTRDLVYLSVKEKPKADHAF